MGAFHFSASAKNLVFQGVTFQSAGATFGVCVLVFVISFGFEKLKLLVRDVGASAAASRRGRRKELDSINLTDSSPHADTPIVTSNQSEFLKFKALEALLYMVQLILAYLLMLVVMDYNANYLIATVTGFGLGHFIFKVL